jgi:single-stranded DNA-binding protein
MSSSITLIGYLGKDREIRQTQERTFTASHYNAVAEMKEEYDVRVPPRDFIRLSLATREEGNSAPTWHQLVVWSPDHRGFRNIRLARKGDLVKVTGRLDTFRYTKDGRTQELQQIVVETFQLLKLKIRHEIS